MNRGAALVAGTVLALTACGGGGGTTTAPPGPRLPAAVAGELVAAVDDPAKLQRRTIAAINAGRVPPALQEPLLARVNAYVDMPTDSRRRALERWLEGGG